MSIGYIKNGKYIEVSGLGGGTGIYVQEDLPADIETEEHWFKILDSLNYSDYSFLFSDLSPNNVKLVNLDEAIGITWNDPTTTSWVGTKLMRRTDKSTAWVLLEDIKNKNKYSITKYIDSNLKNGTKYIYGIFPYSNTEENIENTYHIIPSVIKPGILADIAISEGTNSLIPTFKKNNTITKVTLVYKKNIIPDSIADGTVIDNFESGTAITGLENDTEYKLRFFTYNEKGRCNDSLDMVASGTPAVGENSSDSVVTISNGYPVYITTTDGDSHVIITYNN